ncbi:MAG: M23 family metallopeptidase [Ruminococcaceae bacterium]|nr:M23 family metallopeptidase [Oscillospiraceae bacterium]
MVMKMKNNKNQNAVNSNNSNENKNIKNKNNMYLYAQILITAVMLLSCVILRVKNEDIFYQLKEDYKEFFATETVYESNFSFKSYIARITKETKDKYNEFIQTMAYVYGKGANDTYPSNVSLKKFIPDKPGIMPLSGYITSNYGIRKNPFNSREKDFHTGIDIANEKGTFIKSAFEGIVLETGYTNIAGNYIKIQSDNEVQSFYGHTQFVFVKQGDKILQGQVIATVGDTGLVTGPHLHFEVLYKGERVNPIYTVK